MEHRRELSPDNWTEYFDYASRELLGAPLSIETVAAAGAPSVEAGRLALRLLTYDHRNDVFELAAISGEGRSDSTVRHLVKHPARVSVDNYTLLAPMTIAIDGRDGVRTVIRIERDAEQPG